jgi:hypothetical protein
MWMLNLAIVVFIVLESLNVIVLYFAPDFKQGNGVAAFKQWELSKSDVDNHLFISYLTNWVAGTKIIFIALLLVILLTGNELTKVITLMVLIVTIATYYWRLNPIIHRLDERDQIVPKGYSKTLSLTIFIFMLMFVMALGGYIFMTFLG